MKLIDADVLINEIKKDTEMVIKQNDKVGSFWLGYIAGLVIKQPTIQLESKEGQWIEDDKGNVYCSKCGLHTTKTALKRIALVGEDKPKFCSNCGRRMKGKVNND